MPLELLDRRDLDQQALAARLIELRLGDPFVALARHGAHATMIMHTTYRTRDLLADNDDKVVPLSIRTDGEYVWPGPVAFYVQKYAVAPERDFIEYLRARHFVLRTPQ